MMARLITLLIALLIALKASYNIGYKMHPYEQCSREHVGGDHIGECVWLKLQENE